MRFFGIFLHLLGVGLLVQGFGACSGFFNSPKKLESIGKNQGRSLPEDLGQGSLGVSYSGYLFRYAAKNCQSAPNFRSSVGMNLASVNYYSTSLPSRNLISHGGSFGYNPSNLVVHPKTGMIQSGKGGVFLSTGLSGRYPSGPYVLLNTGGQITVQVGGTIWAASGTPMSNDFVSSSVQQTHPIPATANSPEIPGRFQFNVNPSDNGGVIYITPDSSNPPTSLRLFALSDLQNGEPGLFSSEFLDSLRNFTPLRYMNFLGTNNSPITTWQNRTLPNDPFQGTDRGVALEYFVELSNILCADAWITVPHGADDQYVRNMAKMFAKHLGPGLRVFVEYSNEVWNGLFSQYQYAEQRGQTMGFGSGRDAADGYYLDRSGKVFKIWGEEFAAANRSSELVKVFSIQVSEYWADRILTKRNNATGNYYIHDIKADVIAVAPYFCEDVPTNLSSVTDVLDFCDQSIDLLIPAVKHIRDTAASLGFPLVSYEGGPGITGRGLPESYLQMLYAANEDPRMKTLISKYLYAWKTQMGGELFNYFSHISPHSQYGSWGLWIYQGQGSTPKSEAVMDFISNNPAWWSRY